MTRYYSHVIIEFVDGSTAEIGGNVARVHDGVLTVLTEASYDNRDYHNYPLANIRSWRWKDGGQ